MTERAVRPAGIDPKPDYGIDAPGVLKGFLGSAAVLAGGGLALHGMAPWPFALLSLPAFAGAIVCAGLGLSMLAYSRAGKHRLRDHLLGRRAWRGDEVTLDIGSGRGLMAIGAARRAPRGRTIALDIWSARDLSGNTPEALRANAALEGVAKRIEVVDGDARRLDIADASVDVVTSVLCLHNIAPEADRARACREIARVLKPGGMALIADFPGVAPYMAPLREAGLTVSGPRRAERIAWGIAGFLVAVKDAAPTA